MRATQDDHLLRTTASAGYRYGARPSDHNQSALRVLSQCMVFGEIYYMDMDVIFQMVECARQCMGTCESCSRDDIAMLVRMLRCVLHAHAGSQ